MAAAAVVIILVATAEAQSPAISAALATASETLGPGVAVTMRAVSAPSDAEGLRLQSALGAVAVGTLAWSEGGRESVVIRVHGNAASKWIEQTVTFAAADPLPERARAVGLTLAAMISPAVDTVVNERPRPPPDAAAKQPTKTDAAVSAESAPEPAAPIGPHEATAWSLDLQALGTRGIGGPADGWGALAGLEREVATDWRLRAGAGFRTGEIPGLDGHHSVFHLGAGVAWRPWPSDSARRLGGGARLELAALLHDFVHMTAERTSVHGVRLLPAAVAGVEVTWRVASRLDLVAGGGAELAFGKTDVEVASLLVGTVPPLRLRAELGLRLAF